jgi:DNA-binding CsgD family transcriptional regulator
MTYRELSMTEVKEILRLWLDGRSLRDVSKLAWADRKTVRYADVGITHIMPK